MAYSFKSDASPERNEISSDFNSKCGKVCGPPNTGSIQLSAKEINTMAVYFMWTAIALMVAIVVIPCLKDEPEY